MSDKVKIRKATNDDLNLLKTLDPKFSKKNLDILKYYIQKRGVFIAENKEKDRIDGFILSQILNWINDKRKIVWIEHINIHPECENGVANQLLKHIQEYYRHLIPDIRYVFGNIQPANQDLMRITKGLESVSFFGKIKD